MDRSRVRPTASAGRIRMKEDGLSTLAAGSRKHTYELNAMLRVSRESEDEITRFLSAQHGVRRKRIACDLHLTVYHGRRPLRGLTEGSWPVEVSLDVQETRFMVLAPGGENPRPDLAPGALSVGIRITRRNRAMAEIQKLRESVYRYETLEVIGSRTPTTARTNCFGSRNYQPHIRLLHSWSRVERDLTTVGESFRSEIREIQLDLEEIESRVRIDGEWVSRTGI